MIAFPLALTIRRTARGRHEPSLGRKNTSGNKFDFPYEFYAHVVSRLDVSQLMKLYNPASQFDFQSARSDSKLDDVGVNALVRQRLAVRLRHVRPAGYEDGQSCAVWLWASPVHPMGPTG